MVIEDDGPGIPEGEQTDALTRGKRLDERSEGSGLGLSIVAKTVEAYGGQLALSRATIGGLRVTVSLPAAN